MKTKVPFLMGLAAALFFAITFVVNRLMSISGSSWIWGSSLRFFWMLPMLFIIVWFRSGFQPVVKEIKTHTKQWLLWSTVGFGLFYAPLTYSAAYSPSWLLASTWQITIVAGIIIAPYINPSIPRKGNWHRPALFSVIILSGIAVMQIGQVQFLPLSDILKCIIPVTIAAFAYPLGNRKMMQLTAGRLDVFERLLGMVVCSMPFWLLLSVYEFTTNHSLPQKEQLMQTLIVAVFSGVVATALFFAATEKVRKNESQLAAVEATQAADVVFAVMGEIIVLGAILPNIYGFIGILLVISGMILHSVKGN